MDKKLAKIFKPHPTLTVVGGNWGDEGKGKIIDKVLEYYEISARFSGGANAGHTVFTPEGKKLVSHLIPCGLAQNKICVLARGEFFNAELFLQELEDSKKVLGNNLPPIYIDRQAALWTPYHRLFEAYIEAARGQNKVGTTNKGIGPLEGLYKLRLAPVVGMLFEPEVLEKVVSSLYDVLKPSFESVEFKNTGLVVPEPKSVVLELVAYAPRIKEFAADTALFLHNEFKNGKRMLFEGAQAAGLDAWWGTYPYVSSGNSVAAGAALGTGLPSQNFSATIMVAKTLPTRVGFGPFVSEMWTRNEAMGFAKDHPQFFIKGSERDEFLQAALEKINSGSATNAEMSQYFQVLGDERGATTGRGRSVGFLDIPWLKYALRINGPKWLALTRFDMLSKIKTIPVVVGYKLDGKILEDGELPPPWQLEKIEPVFETWEGFSEDISGISDGTKLPKAAENFISKLEKHLGIPVLLVGTGPGREAIVLRD